MPLVRNSLVYARIAYQMLDLGPEFTMAEHGYQKSLGFASLSLPLVKLYGATVGLKLSSLVWTALWTLSTLLIFLRLKVFMPARQRTAENLVLAAFICVFNPLSFYQFVSAYPDTMSAFFFLWAIFFLARMTSRKVRWFHGPAFAAATLCAVWVKYQGLVIVLIMLAFVIFRWRELVWQRRHARAGLAWWCGAVAVVLILLALAKSYPNPFINFQDDTRASASHVLVKQTRLNENLKALADYLWISFGAFTILLVRLPRLRRLGEWYTGMVIFLATSLLYQGTHYNPRYFLPLTPFLAWLIVQNIGLIPRRGWRIACVTLHSVWMIVATLYYNDLRAHHFLSKPMSLPRVDNLRLADSQLEATRNIAAVNASVREGRDVLIFISNYYDDGMWYTWERDGYFPAVTRVIYVKQWDQNLMRRVGLREAVVYKYAERSRPRRQAEGVDRVSRITQVSGPLVTDNEVRRSGRVFIVGPKKPGTEPAPASPGESHGDG